MYTQSINYMQIYHTILQAIAAINYVRNNNNNSSPNLHENYPAPNSFIQHIAYSRHTIRAYLYGT